METSGKKLSELSDDDFRKIIENAVSTRSTHIFKNGSAANANIVIANIFKNSSNVRIFADDMNGKIGDCLSDYFKELQSFLHKTESKIKIVLMKRGQVKSEALKFLTQLSSVDKNKVEIKLASENFKREIDTISIKPDERLYFVVGDENKFRLQYDNHTNSAYFSFNNTDIPKKLTSIFDSNWDKCTSY